MNGYASHNDDILDAIYRVIQTESTLMRSPIPLHLFRRALQDTRKSGEEAAEVIIAGKGEPGKKLLRNMIFFMF
jgi:phosphoribosyl-ATP pyrophosphohydrolase